MTGNDTIIGTVYYMSPEQCNALKDVDGRADVYSLGVVLCEMLTGSKPYTEGGLISIIQQHIKEPTPRLPDDLSPYQPLIDKMMAKDKTKRLSTGPEFAQLLDRIKNSLTN
jgi:serine/threonine-protein kinase PpkA